LEPPLDVLPRGVYKLDREYDFNVLDAVHYDAGSRQISLIGHRDERFAGPPIPYLQHLATLLENPKPKFSLNMTPDTLARIDAFFKLSLSPREPDQIYSQLGVVFDASGNVTSIGRYMLPAMGFYPVFENKTPGFLGAETQITREGATTVTRVIPGSPAANAGIAPGDLITFFNDQYVYHPADLARRVRFAGAGSDVDLTYQRGMQSFKETVTLTTDSEDPWITIDRYAVLATFYREVGNEDAARVIDAFGLIKAAPKQNPALGAAVNNFYASLGLSEEFASALKAGGGATSAGVAAGVALGQTVARRLDEIFAFPGHPVLTAYNANISRTLGPAMDAALNQFDTAIKPKAAELIFDRAYDRPEGIQIAPELIESIFHVRPEMTPAYLGVPPNTLLARAMFDGDYLIKRLVNRPDLKIKIPQYQTQFEFKQTHPEQREDSSTYRTWVSLGTMDAAQSADGDTLEFRNVQMRFNIREIGKNGADLPSKPNGYEDLLTSLYDDFAHEYPTLNELREAEKLAAVATWLNAKSPSIRLAKDGTVAWQGPSKVPGLVFVYFFKRGDSPKIDMIAEGGVNLDPFPLDSSVVDLRGLAAGGPASRGTPLMPIDPSIVDLRGLPAGGSPEVYRRDLATLLGHPVDVVVPQSVGATTQVTTGKGTYQMLTATLNSLSVVDAERALEQRDELEKDRNLALRLWVVERAIDIIKQGSSDWMQQLQELQNESANANLPLNLIANANIQSLANNPSQLDSLRAALVGQQKQVAGELDADPMLKSAAAQVKPAAGAKPWPCPTDGTFCTNDKVTMPGLAPTSSPGALTTSASPSGQLQAMTGGDPNKKSDPNDIECVFVGGQNCKKADPIVFNKPDQRPRGSASLSADELQAMNTTAEGQKLLEKEKTLQAQLDSANAKLNEIRKEKDAATDPAERNRLEVDYSNADDDKSQIAQQLSVAEDAVETQAKTFVLDK
jgi:hypothetical protein